MKKFFRILSIIVLVILLGLYGAFLFVVPKVVNLNQYKPMIQKLVKEYSRLNIDFSKVKVSTTPTLGAGVKVYDVDVKFDDASELFSADKVTLNISLPSLLGLTLRVSTAEVLNPKVNLDIVDDRQYKVVKLVEDIANSQKPAFTKVNTAPASQVPFDPSWIRILVPAFTLKNYELSVNDIKNKQNMVLSGDKIALGYYNGKKAKVQADAELLVDGQSKINANVLIDSFIPEFQPSLDEEDDPTQRLEIPFVNPIKLYKTYDLKTNVNAKVKVREKNKRLSLNGFAYIDDLTMNLSGYQLPKSYMHYGFWGQKVQLDTDLYITPNQHIQAQGAINYGKRLQADMKILTTKIGFNEVILLAKSVLDTFAIPNNLENIKAQGYFQIDTEFNTNLKKLKSQGYILVKDGALFNKKAGLFIKDGNVDISLDDNAFDIKKAGVLVNGVGINAHGKITQDAVSDLQLKTKGLSLRELYSVFAPRKLKSQFEVKSGLLSLDARIQGELKQASAEINAGLKNFSMAESKNAFVLSNEDLAIKINAHSPSLEGVIANKSFRINIPSTSSSVYFPYVAVNLDENNITIPRSGLKFNNSSVINFDGNIFDYMKNPNIDFNVDGRVASNDLKMFVGKEISGFIDGKGAMPLKAQVKGPLNKLSIILQLMTDGTNYFTPINFDQLRGKQNIIQFNADYKGNRIKIKDTGIYTKTPSVEFGDDLAMNIAGATPVVYLSSTITRLDFEPYINLLRISIPKSLTGDIYALKNSKFKLDKTMFFAFGEAINPRLRGVLQIHNLSMPELFTAVEEIRLDLRARRLMFNVTGALVNDSDFNIDGSVNLNALPLIVIPELNVISERIDVNKLLLVSEAATKLLSSQQASNSQSGNSSNVEIPVVVQNGRIDFKKIIAPPIEATNTRGRIWLRDNIFHLDNLRTSALGGSVNGSVNMNLVNSLLGVKVHGENFDVKNALLVLANMKDALEGVASFDTDITLDAAAATQAQQMKSIKGSVDFEIRKGQLGPFGRIENLILAENIRNSKFFETAIGSVINSITTIETSHFNVMNGHLTFSDGVVKINPITTVGDVLCLYIAGDMNLLTNDADMKLRARMGSQLFNMLGPLAAINPVNLVKVTPGLNVMAAQAFQFFCEPVTLEEMNLLPDFNDEFSAMSTTKFQVVLKGNMEKPLSMIKSFKWLALDSEIAAAETFVSSLPDPTIVENPQNATYEEIMAAKAEQEALQAKEDAKLINRVKRLFKLGKYKEQSEE